jgi:hypothetical protein
VPKVGITPRSPVRSQTSQIHPEDDSPMAAAETVDLSWSREPKSARIAAVRYSEMFSSLLKAVAGGGFYDNFN